MKLMTGVVASVCVCAPAAGSITSTTGDLVQIAQPLDAEIDHLVSSPSIYCWNEAQGYTLTAPLLANAKLPGVYDDASDLVMTGVPAGATINSHYVHFDAFGTAGATGSGVLTFDGPIVAVICLNQQGGWFIDDSDFLGAPTSFTHGEEMRGMELSSPSDSFTIAADSLSIEINMGIAIPGDYIRIITRPAVPSPGTTGVLGIVLAAGLRRRR